MHKSKKTRLSKTWMDGEEKESNQKCNSQQDSEQGRDGWMQQEITLQIPFLILFSSLALVSWSLTHSLPLKNLDIKFDKF